MKKVIFFIYGIICYVIFLGVFLYSIGFVGNLYVPKSVDTGQESTFLTALIVNALLLSLFALQHSIMARPVFKRWWTKMMPQPIERSTYVLATNLVLILLYWQRRPMTDIVWKAENHTVIILWWALFALGWLIVLLSTFMINHFDLFGLKHVAENLSGKETRPLSFTKRYFYALVRHPLMLGLLSLSGPRR